MNEWNKYRMKNEGIYRYLVDSPESWNILSGSSHTMRLYFMYTQLRQA